MALHAYLDGLIPFCKRRLIGNMHAFACKENMFQQMIGSPFPAPFVVAKLPGNISCLSSCIACDWQLATTTTYVQRQVCWPWPHNRRVARYQSIKKKAPQENCSLHITVSQLDWNWPNAEENDLMLRWPTNGILVSYMLGAIYTPHAFDRFGDGNSSSFLLISTSKGGNADLPL
jgi:hypothetical protein